MHKSLLLVAALAVLPCSALVIVHAQGRGQQQTAALPDGAGREAVQSTCAKCHGLNLISGSWGNTDAGWRELFGSMVTLPKPQADTIAGYLGKHFPPKPAPESAFAST